MSVQSFERPPVHSGINGGRPDSMSEIIGRGSHDYVDFNIVPPANGIQKQYAQHQSQSASVPRALTSQSLPSPYSPYNSSQGYSAPSSGYGVHDNEEIRYGSNHRGPPSPHRPTNAASQPGGMNVGNHISDRSSVRSLAPPGGVSTIWFG